MLALVGCNAERASPELSLPPVPTSIRVTPPGEALPQADGCAASILRTRAEMDDELAARRIVQAGYDAAQAEIAEAERACARGDNLSAEGLLRAARTQAGAGAAEK